MTTPTFKVGRKTYGATALFVLAVLFIGIVLLSTFALRGARIDLTESKLYTIAPGTQRILTSLEEPVNLYFFFSQDASKQDAQLRAYSQRVRELLEELAQRSKGKVRLSIVDPKPFSEDEDRAAEFGLVAAPVRPGGEPIYFGLAGTNSTDGRETIPLFVSAKEEFLEYDVVSLIHRLGTVERTKVGLLSSLPVDASFDQMSGRMQPGWISIQQMRELLDVRNLSGDVARIDDDIDVLMLVHPKQLPEPTLYAIDQFVMRGGKLIAFVDPQSENDPAGAQGGPMGMMAPRASTLGPLMDAWGVQYDPGQFVGDRDLGLTVPLRQDEPPSQHIQIISFNRDAMSSSDVVTATLDKINVWSAGALSKKDDATITFEPLIQSSSNAALLPTMRLALQQESASLLDGFKASGERYAIAARVSGKLESAFASKPAGADAGIEHRTESAGEANLIFVADTDLLADPLWVRTQNFMGQVIAMTWANNGDFLANALDNLAGSADLISIRGRQSFFRPFTKVDELRRQADDRLRAKAQELDQELRATEEKLSALELGRSGDGGSLVLSPAQEAELTRFQQERVRIRKELREVQRGLDVEIETLGKWLKGINIVLVPALLAIGALVLAIVRRRRLKAGRAAAHTG